MSFINNQFKTPSYKPANLGLQPKIKGPTSKLGGTPTAFSPVKPVSSAWSTLGKGKSVDDIMGGTVGPTKPQAPAIKTTPTNQTGIVGSVPSGPEAFGTNPKMGTQTSTAAVTSPAGKRMLKSDRDKQKKGLVQTTEFGSILGRLTDASKASKEQKGLLSKLESEADRNRQIADQAKQYSEQYGNEIARVGQLGAGAVAGNMSTGSNVVGSGNAAIASNSASSRIAALSQAQQAALAGTGQQLTGQRQLTDTLGQALSGANVQQQQGITALGQAGNLAAPNPAAYGQTVFDPATGTFTAGGNMDPQNQAGSLAQAVMSGQMTYAQALATMGYAGNAGTTFLNNAITSAGGNPLQLEAQNAAQQANITTGGTAQTQIAREGLGGAVQQYVQLTNYAQAAKQQANDMLNIMNTANVNNVPLIRANKTINTIASEVSDPNIKAFQTALVEARSLYARLLSTGGSTPTENDQRALVALDGNSTPQATAAAIEQLENSVRNILVAQQNAVQTYQSNLGGGSNGSGGSFTSEGGGSFDW